MKELRILRDFTKKSNCSRIARLLAAKKKSTAEKKSPPGGEQKSG
jgi:hypothetical protein